MLEAVRDRNNRYYPQAPGRTHPNALSNISLLLGSRNNPMENWRFSIAKYFQIVTLLIRFLSWWAHWQVEKHSVLKIWLELQRSCSLNMLGVIKQYMLLRWRVRYNGIFTSSRSISHRPPQYLALLSKGGNTQGFIFADTSFPNLVKITRSLPISLLWRKYF